MNDLPQLLQRHYELVGRDVYKERDCHWVIEKRWSYGDATPTYWVLHDGYSVDSVERGPFGTPGGAHAALRNALRDAIRELEQQEG